MRHRLAVKIAVLLLAGCAARSEAPAPAIAVPGRWAASENLRITVYGGPAGPVTLTRGHRDWKPVWSPSGGWLTFFRTSRDSGAFVDWQADLWVVAADGSGERRLTDARGRDFNPTWTRDGTNRILFNRYGVNGEPDRCEVWVTSPDGAPGSEVRISSPAHRFEWAQAGLRDGRVFVDTVAAWLPVAEMRSWLLTPVPGGAGRYEEIARPTSGMWHKLSVSPSETKVAYMLDRSGNLGDYRDDVLYWAEFDRDARAVKNPVRITEPTGGRCVNEYPRWSADEKLILFDSTCSSGTARVYAYRLSDGAVAPISPRTGEWVMFPCAEGVPQ